MIGLDKRRYSQHLCLLHLRYPTSSVRLCCSRKVRLIIIWSDFFSSSDFPFYLHSRASFRSLRNLFIWTWHIKREGECFIRFPDIEKRVTSKQSTASCYKWTLPVWCLMFRGEIRCDSWPRPRTNVEIFVRLTKLSQLSSWNVRRLAQSSSSEWVWIVQVNTFNPSASDGLNVWRSSPGQRVTN